MISEKWLQIPVAPKYEINRRGDVRNTKTGRILKPIAHGNDKRYSLIIGANSRQKTFSQKNLLWLVHGIDPERAPHLLPVVISRNGESYSFDTCKQAAQFIADREYYAVCSVTNYFCKRREEVYGWRINYQR